MSRISRIKEVVQEINNISEECSEIDEGSQSEREDELDEFLESDHEIDSEYENYSSNTEEEEEDILNASRRRKRMRLLTDSEDNSEENNEQENIEIAIDGTVWKKIETGSSPGRPPLHAIFKDVSGPTGHAKRNIMKGKVSTAFHLLFDNHIMEYIIKCTELEARGVLGKEWSLPRDKLEAFIGILYIRGAYEQKNVNASFLWNKKWGPSFFSNTMSRNCFIEILRFLRFDKKNERSQRLGEDKFALVSKVWYSFIENSQNCYKPATNITVDEQLFPTKARCRFTQYMPNKPDKFGIKFWLASDVKSKYIVNGFPYLGKDETRPASVSLGESVVLKLIEPFTGSGRNVTTDNFFTSSSLATKLLQKKTSLVGTIRQNKRELPKPAKIKKDKMERFSVQLYASNNSTLTIYKSKPNKKVLLLSSRHKSVQVENSNKRLPETIKFYNSTKFGVDMTDQMARKYSVKCKCRRWPMHVFYNILDLIGINAWVLYKETTGEIISRRDFLFQLGEELAAEYKERHERTTNTATSSAASCKITSFSKREKKCQVKYCSGNRATRICSQCKKYTCGKCLVEQPFICKKCGIE